MVLNKGSYFLLRMKKKLKVSICISILITLFSFQITSTVSAHYYSHGYSLYSMTYNYSGTNASYIFGQAARNWQDEAGTSIYYDSRSENLVYVDDYPFSWYGNYRWYDSNSNGIVDKFRIRVNHDTLIKRYPNNYYSAAISTATHEFGHAQYLSDLDSGYGDSSIMSYGRNRTLITKPQSHDLYDLYNYRN